LREKFGEMREVLDVTIRKLVADDGAAWAKAHGRTMEGLETAGGPTTPDIATLKRAEVATIPDIAAK
jgi:hypothetical protein